MVKENYFGHESGLRGFRADTASLYASLLKNTDAEYLMFGTSRPRLSKVSHVPIVGFVAAGVVQPAEPIAEADLEYVTMREDPRFPDVQRYLLNVRGNSMDEVIPDGSTVEVIAFEDVGCNTEPDKYYVIDVTLPDGTIESTLKQYHVDPEDNAWLLPRSTDPRHKAPIDLNGTKNDTINIRARVIKVILPV
jgi:phage repressor protein C with HTH and peptisase S24 domain